MASSWEGYQGWTAGMVRKVIGGHVSSEVIKPSTGLNPVDQALRVVDDAAALSEATVDPAAPVGLAAVVGLPADWGAPRGSTSEPQAGQCKTLSGRRRISGWPHSQGWLPNASGRAVTCLRVSSIAPLTRSPQAGHRAE